MNPRSFAPLLVAALFGCAPAHGELGVPTASASASAPAPSASAVGFDQPFRKTAPKPTGEVVFRAPAVEEIHLSNGLRVLFVEQTGLPIVAVNVASKTGQESSNVPGLGGLTAAMMMRGTTGRDAIQLGDDIEAIGANIETFGDFDTIGIGGKGLVSTLPTLLDLVADVAMHPAFDAKELDRERSRRMTILKTQVDRPGTLLGNAIGELLYAKDNPYASPLLGTEASLGGIKRDQLVSFHRERFAISKVTISVAGNVKKDVLVPMLEKAFGGWPADTGSSMSAKIGGKRPESSPHVLLIDRPGAPQSSMMFVSVGVPRSSPDYDALSVMNTIFGGPFSSRLNLNLREAHAYTYGAGSRFDFRHGAGPFSAGGEIVREKTGAAAKEVLGELDRMRTLLVSAEELADAKSTLIDALPARFETAGATAGSFASLATYDLPLDEFATRPARLARITPEDVRRVAKTYLDPNEILLVVVGDAAVVKPQLEELHLGDVVVRAATK